MTPSSTAKDASRSKICLILIDGPLRPVSLTGNIDPMSQQILNLDDLTSLEKRYAGILGESELMRRAGDAVARVIADRVKTPAHVVVICGPGNNGGDGYAAALALQAKGYRVTCATITGGAPVSETAKSLYDAWIASGGETVTDPYSADKAQVVVDALFGTGLKRAILNEWQDAVLWFNERQALHVSIDLPSGIDMMTGRWVGNIPGCRADVTVNLLAPKAGCFMNEGADAAGAVLLDNLDVSVPLTNISLIDTDDFKHLAEPRAKNSHKGTYGRVVVIGGETGTVGAAFLAGRAALKMGAGSVVVEVMSDKAPAFDPLQPELMVTDKADLSLADAIVVGCGMGFSEKAKQRFKDAIACNVPLIIDADALRMLAEDQALQDSVLARKAHTVITPHPGEAAAIIHSTVEKVNADRINASRELAVQTGCVSILKGAGSVVSLRSSRTWINPTGNAMLATAGSGDVLAGMLAAMFAQKYDLVSATLSAVWLHGEAVKNRAAGVTAGTIAKNAAEIVEGLRQKTYTPDDIYAPGCARRG